MIIIIIMTKRVVFGIKGGGGSEQNIASVSLPSKEGASGAKAAKLYSSTISHQIATKGQILKTRSLGALWAVGPDF